MCRISFATLYNFLHYICATGEGGGLIRVSCISISILSPVYVKNYVNAQDNSAK